MFRNVLCLAVVLNLLLGWGVCLDGLVHSFTNRGSQQLESDHHVEGAAKVFSVDDAQGLGRLFDGIGAISGGGATSKLLVSYAEPHRSNILDYLFKPGFGASLQILKVEIGGDSQSSDGSESSHMHTANDQNYNRGYEWWLMTEAKKRNPAIKLYGLPWTWPGWVGGGVLDPYINSTATAYYIINWINGAALYHNLTIDYIGVWNERKCDPTYVKLLRKLLNENGHSRIQIVVPDAMDWSIVEKLIEDPAYADAIDIIGQHYPGGFSPETARQMGKRLWASEEYSTKNGLPGGGCWARVLSESPVNAQITSFIAWNMIASYYDGFPYTENGLMSATEPWSGHYVVNSPIWMTAHHTQFYSPGWSYLMPYHGLHNLTGNGTIIALTSPDRQDLTIVIETIDPVNSSCSYPFPHFTVADEQDVVLVLGGSFEYIEQMNLWYSHLDFTGAGQTVLFENLGPIQVTDKTIRLRLKKNDVYTLTTMMNGQKGDYGKPPKSQTFPVNYSENFESYDIGAEPALLSQQSGAFEVTAPPTISGGKVLTQVVTQPPVDTCTPKTFIRPANLFGDYRWKNAKVEMDVYLNKSSPIGADGVFLASQVNGGGCLTIWAAGIFYFISLVSRTAKLMAGQEHDSQVFDEIPLLSLDYDQWFNMALDVQNNTALAYLNGQLIMQVDMPQPPSKFGFIAFGPDIFGIAHFDNLRLHRAEVAPKEEWEGYIEEKQRKHDVLTRHRKSHSDQIPGNS